MKKTMVENRLNNALKRLYYFDNEIIDNYSNERSITHRLAIHLGTVFYEWDVDVEYNRNLNDIKKFNEWTMKLLHDLSDNMDFLTGAKTVFPDIIIHKRGTRDNLIAIEVKKINTSERLEQYDIDKIKGYILDESLNYQYAAFIKLGLSSDNNKYKIVLKSREEVQLELTHGELNFS
ncbi:hypothetical protein [Anaerocolumna xylanovorans]|uniref:PD-(D/E)XK nuclease superfamily protein n=1 Tax=Anaerocolumna xylanovorans DSM 12503 TaxID=1121345 RepID=A0A1M7Y4A1_9FIRM|nr:hypothetical protein [Anaerocolumna xylanovorans]SHO46883.1 hypothetical protein SAMN02745217_01323 [Anaerocolumna xylanovorans DSM 12503]